jgi:DNA-binding Xre family transcriptional regulator
MSKAKLLQQKSRQRGVILSEKGKVTVREVLKMRGWSILKLSREAILSESTIKRILHGDKTDRISIEDMCKALSLNPDELIVSISSSLERSSSLESPNSMTPFLTPQLSEPLFTEYLDIISQGFMITGTFSPNKLTEIKVALMHLEKLLLEQCTITLVPNSNYLAVTGEFDEKQKPQVEVTLMHLEKLLLEYNITSN